MQSRAVSVTLSDMVENAVFLIADISGYTEYLARSDLRHGPVIASDLLSTVVEAMRSQFTVNKLEGDAVFTFSTDPELRGEDLIRVIDDTYLAFRRRLLSVSQATSCGCPSCGLIPRLDLKLIAHWGEFSRQVISGSEELAGSDVIVAHRLLKNSLGFAGSGAGRVILTDTCVRRLAIDPSRLQMEPHTETYLYLGDVQTWVGELGSRLETQSWRPPRTILHEAIRSYPGPPDAVWNALAPGRSEACVTDRLATVHQVEEWRPFQALVVQIKVFEAELFYQLTLDQQDTGTTATVRWYPSLRAPRGPSWSEISKRLAVLTEESLRAAERLSGDRPLHFDKSRP